MKKIEIKDIKKPFLHYECINPKTISEQGFLNFFVKSEVEDLGNLKEVAFEFRLKIFEVTPSFEQLLASTDDTKLEKELDNQKEEALFHLKYKVLIHTDMDFKKITKDIMLNTLEAYIRKDLLDFYQNVELPPISIPAQLWEISDDIND